MSAASDLLSNYQHLIKSLSLLAGDKGIFDVEVNGDKIYSKHETERHAAPGEVLEIFANHVGPEISIYGT